MLVVSLEKQLKKPKIVETKRTKKKTEEPTSGESASQAPLWNLLELFVLEVLGMDKNRIDGIRTLGDRLAEMIKTEDDKGLFRQVYEAKHPDKVRNLLNKLSFQRIQKGLEPSIRLDEYVMIFDENGELSRADFWVAWDLIKMRVIETLFDLDRDWITRNKEIITDIQEKEEEK